MRDETKVCFMQIDAPADMLRRMFVDGVLPEAGDVVEQVVAEIYPEQGRIATKLRVVRATTGAGK